jgi:hypothetical protein
MAQSEDPELAILPSRILIVLGASGKVVASKYVEVK